MGLHGWLIWKMPVTTLITLKLHVIPFEEFEEITASLVIFDVSNYETKVK